jgi:hypothetical protein
MAQFGTLDSAQRSALFKINGVFRMPRTTHTLAKAFNQAGASVAATSSR